MSQTPGNDEDRARLLERITQLEHENRLLCAKAEEVASANVTAAMELVELTEERSRVLEAKNAEIAAALAAAEEASKQKSQFLANMSHELRTPISGIIGMCELIADGELSAQQRDRVDAIIATADSFLDLVNQLLDFSKAEARAIELEAHEFDLWNVCESVAQLLHVQAADKGVDMLFQLEPDVPRVVTGDRLRLRQILLNLGGNAVKFTDRGFVSLSVRGVPGEAGCVEFEFGDTGCGFDDSHSERLFQPFVQADASTTRRYGGTGLGLAICRQLVDLMAGSITCHGERDRGSTFWLRLPFDEQPRAVAAPCTSRTARVFAARCHTLQMLADHLPRHGFDVVYEDLTGARADDLIVVEAAVDSHDLLQRVRARFAGGEVLLIEAPGSSPGEREYEQLGVERVLQQPLRPSQFAALSRTHEAGIGAAASRGARLGAGRVVLIADDSEINRRVLGQRLRVEGFEVVEAVDGQRALDAYAGGEFDLVFLDCQMPTVDGYQAAVGMRELERCTGRSRVPIIALTADASVANHARCLRSGMDMFCVKPLRARDVEGVLQRCFTLGVPPTPTAG